MDWKPSTMWSSKSYSIFLIVCHVHCVKIVCIRSFSGPYFPALRRSPYSVRTRENTDQKNSKYGHFLRSGCVNRKKEFYMIALNQILPSVVILMHEDVAFFSNSF